MSTEVRSNSPVLLLTPSAFAAGSAEKVYLDEKTVSGLRSYSAKWPGRMRCLFRSGPEDTIPFGRWHDVESLPFDIKLIPAGGRLTDAELSGASVILASGDNWLDFPLAEQGRRLGIPVCYVIEYTFSTRVIILNLSETTTFVKKLKSFVWLLLRERERRQAFKISGLLQANGTPAALAYAKYAPNTLTFFDTRLNLAQLATPQELEKKRDRIRAGDPLRLIYTGRLERMKGADHLIEVAKRIEVPFRLDLFGEGNLRTSIVEAIDAAGLNDCVRVNPAVNFDDALVPMMKSEADVFLCCHVQADPSCTYLETLGCGVPILGYENEAWKGVLERSGGGWSVPVGKPDRMAAKINELHRDREEIAKKAQLALDFAKDHSFEHEFARRVDHLIAIAKLES